MSLQKKGGAAVRSPKGFSLIELLIYVGILAVTAGVLVNVLTMGTNTQLKQTSQDKLSGQLSFAMQTIQRLAQSSSLIEMNATTTSSTLKLRMQNPAQDPTLVYLSNGVIYVQQGTTTPQALTDGSVTVASLQFQKFSQYPGKDVVQIDIAMNDPSQPSVATRSLRSAISRASAATFDSDLIPGTDNSFSVGVAGSNARWKNALFSGNVGIGGTFNPSYPLDVETAGNGIFVSSTATSSNYFALNLQAGTKPLLYVANNSQMGIGTTVGTPSLYYSTNTVTIIGDATSPYGAQLELSPKGGVSTTISSVSKLRFRSTFDNYSSDQRPRTSAQITSGFSGGTWGNEYLGFDVGMGGVGISNDSSTDPIEIFRATRTGITMGSLAGSSTPFRISNVASPATSTDVATKGYVDSAVGSAGGSAGTVLFWSTSTPPSGYTYTGLKQLTSVGTTNLPTALSMPAATVDSNGNLYVIGGNNGSSDTNGVYRYNPSTNAWATLASAPVAASSPNISIVGDLSGNIYLFSATDTQYWDDLAGVTTTVLRGAIRIDKFDGTSWTLMSTTTALINPKKVFASQQKNILALIIEKTTSFFKDLSSLLIEKVFALPVVYPPDINPGTGTGYYGVTGFGNGINLGGILKIPMWETLNGSTTARIAYVNFNPSTNTSTRNAYAPGGVLTTLQCLAMRSDQGIYGFATIAGTRFPVTTSGSSGFWRFSSAALLLASANDSWYSTPWMAPCVWTSDQNTNYVFGGYDTSTSPYGSYIIYAYDAAHRAIYDTGLSLAQNRYAASAAINPQDNLIYVIGGKSYDGTSITTLSSVEMLRAYYVMRKN